MFPGCAGHIPFATVHFHPSELAMDLMRDGGERWSIVAVVAGGSETIRDRET